MNAYPRLVDKSEDFRSEIEILNDSMLAGTLSESLALVWNKWGGAEIDAYLCGALHFCAGYNVTSEIMFLTHINSIKQGNKHG